LGKYPGNLDVKLENPRGLDATLGKLWKIKIIVDNMLETGNRYLSFETAALTDTGKVRHNNEDRLFVLNKRIPNQFEAKSIGIYLVADGMGGHQAGEIASEMAMRIITDTLLNSLGKGQESVSPYDLVVQSIEKANIQIYNRASLSPELYAMGTTVTLGFRLDNDLYLGHVGDSRAYLIRKGQIRLLTEDHSLVAELVKKGVITPNEAKTHPDRGKILRCLGGSDNIRIDTLIQASGASKIILADNDSMLFCSDGLNSSVSDGEILRFLSDRESASKTCKKLIDLANSRGGGDNISVIVVNVKSL
jgi:serine/threonine protein phosphatase PrpC